MPQCGDRVRGPDRPVPFPPGPPPCLCLGLSPSSQPPPLASLLPLLSASLLDGGFPSSLPFFPLCTSSLSVVCLKVHVGICSICRLVSLFLRISIFVAPWRTLSFSVSVSLSRPLQAYLCSISPRLWLCHGRLSPPSLGLCSSLPSPRPLAMDHAHSVQSTGRGLPGQLHPISPVQVAVGSRMCAPGCLPGSGPSWLCVRGLEGGPSATSAEIRPRVGESAAQGCPAGAGDQEQGVETGPRYLSGSSQVLRLRGKAPRSRIPGKLWELDRI